MPTRIRKGIKKLRKGIKKIPENKCFSERTLAWAAPRKSRERDGRTSGRLQVSRLSSKTFKICRLNSHPALLRTQNLLKMWQSIQWIDWSKDTKRFGSVLLSLGNVVHSDNDEESLYACCCTQKVAVKGCHRWLSQSTDIFTNFNEVNF